MIEIERESGRKREERKANEGREGKGREENKERAVKLL